MSPSTTTIDEAAVHDSSPDTAASIIGDAELPPPSSPSSSSAETRPEQFDTDLGPARLRAGRERSFARRIAVKAMEIAAAPEPDRNTLAGLLGCPPDVVSLTAEVMGAPRGAATRAVTDLDEIAAADPMEAPIKVATMGRDRERALWNLLASLGVVGSSPPLNEFKQALATAKAVFAVDEAIRAPAGGCGRVGPQAVTGQSMTSGFLQALRIMIGQRCRSWRPRPCTTHPLGHLPWRCRTCWRPCLKRVQRGESRCGKCMWALAQHPDPRVRLALLASRRVPAEVLELLVTDPDPLVADRADWVAAFRGDPVHGRARTVTATGSG